MNFFFETSNVNIINRKHLNNKFCKKQKRKTELTQFFDINKERFRISSRKHKKWQEIKEKMSEKLN